MSYQAGLKLGVPIALGYFAVSMAYGLSAVVLGFRPLEAALISITNLTSAGQFAGTSLIAVAAPLSELILTTLVINARYFLMALSFLRNWRKPLCGSGCSWPTALQMRSLRRPSASQGQLSFAFMMGLITLPVAGWTAGTYAGAAASSLLSAEAAGACSVAMYGMFIAILVPKARQDHSAALCMGIACILSLCAWWLQLSSGWSVILVTVLSAGFMAWMHPETDSDTDPEGERHGLE